MAQIVKLSNGKLANLSTGSLVKWTPGVSLVPVVAKINQSALDVEMMGLCRQIIYIAANLLKNNTQSEISNQGLVKTGNLKNSVWSNAVGVIKAGDSYIGNGVLGMVDYGYVLDQVDSLHKAHNFVRNAFWMTAPMIAPLVKASYTATVATESKQQTAITTKPKTVSSNQILIEQISRMFGRVKAGDDIRFKFRQDAGPEIRQDAGQEKRYVEINHTTYPGGRKEITWSRPLHGAVSLADIPDFGGRLAGTIVATQETRGGRWTPQIGSNKSIKNAYYHEPTTFLADNSSLNFNITSKKGQRGWGTVIESTAVKSIKEIGTQKMLPSTGSLLMAKQDFTTSIIKKLGITKNGKY